MRIKPFILTILVFILFVLGIYAWNRSIDEQETKESLESGLQTQSFQFADSVIEFEISRSIGEVQSQLAPGSLEDIYATTQSLIDASNGGCIINGPNSLSPLGIYSLSKVAPSDVGEENPLYVAQHLKSLDGGWQLYFTSPQSTCGAPKLEIKLVSELREAVIKTARLK